MSTSNSIDNSQHAVMIQATQRYSRLLKEVESIQREIAGHSYLWQQQREMQAFEDRMSLSLVCFALEQGTAHLSQLMQRLRTSDNKCAKSPRPYETCYSDLCQKLWSLYQQVCALTPL